MSIALDRIFALGDSHVRICSSSRHFIPLFAAPGREMLFLTAEHAEVTENRLRENLRRLPANAKVLLFFGEPDIRTHLSWFPDNAGVSIDDGIEVLVRAAERYGEMLDRLRADFKHDLAVLLPTPSPKPVHNRLAKHYISNLKTSCEALHIPALDIWEHVFDYRRQAVIPEFDADGIHLEATACPFICEKLKTIGWLAQAASSENDFRWQHNHQFDLGNRALTRIWGDVTVNPGGMRFVHTRTIDYALLRIEKALGDVESGNVFVLCSREGYVAFNLSDMAASRIIGIESDPVRREVAEILSKFAGKDRVTFAPSCIETEIRPEILLILETPEPNDWPEIRAALRHRPRVAVWLVNQEIPPQTEEIHEGSNLLKYRFAVPISAGDLAERQASELHFWCRSKADKLRFESAATSAIAVHQASKNLTSRWLDPATIVRKLIKATATKFRRFS
jgi:hypothetical protein